jgi:outer membrane receptor protein involved in Fe transport
MKPRYPITSTLCRLLAASACSLFAVTFARAQAVANPASPAPAADETKKVIPLETSDEKPSNEVVTLSPFEVVTDTKGYYSANSMSGTRFNSKLEDMASSISVVTKEQMNDFAMLDINDIFNYTANTEGTGTYTDFSINRNGDTQDNVMANPTNANRVRGVSSANYAFNNIQTMSRVPVDPIGLDSVEVSRGPNANIFGLGNPSGTINMVPSAANTSRNFTTVSARTDSYDGYRTSLDANRILAKGVLAVRGQTVFQHEGFQRKPSGVDTTRYNGMIKYQPFKSTTITAGVSYYNTTGNRPNFVTPRDNVSYWARSGKPTWDPIAQVIHVNGQTINELGLSGATATAYTTDQNYSYFQQSYTGSNHAFAYVDQNGLTYWAAPTGFSNATPLAGATTAGPTSGAQKFLLATAPSANATLGRSTNQPLFTTTPTVGDKSLYDYSAINLAAVNRMLTRTITSSFQIDQLFFNTPRQTFAGQAGFFREDSTQMQRNLLATQNANGQSGQLFVDINEKNLDGTPNPYLGRAYIATDQPITLLQPAKWDTYRAQLAYKLDLSREKNWLRWLGLTQFTAYDEYKYRINRQYGFKDAMSGPVSWIPAGQSRANQGAITGGPAAALNITRNYFRYYVGGKDGVVDYAPSTFGYGNYPFVWGNTSTGAFHADQIGLQQVAVTDSTGGGSNTKVILKSIGAVMQNHLLDDKLVTTFGLREDQQYTKAGSTPQLLNSDGETLNYDSVNHWAPGDYRFNSGKTKTGGAVLRPFRDLRFVRQLDEGSGAGHFIGNLLRGMSFTYNKSDSFIPAGFATDLYLNPLPVPTGHGKDYGVAFNMLDGRVVLRWNHYENTSINNRGGDAGTIAQRVTRIDITSTATFLLLTQATNWVTATNPNFTTAQVQAEVARQIGVPTATSNALIQAFNAGTITATQDITAKGDELELNFNPTRYWTVSANGAQTQSINTNVATSISSWINQRMPIWTSIVDPTLTDAATVNDVDAVTGAKGNPGHLWWIHNYGGSQTPQQNYIAFVQTPYAVTQQKQGKANPQIGRYSAKISTNVQLAAFTENKILKAINVGGALRWQSPVAIDYYGTQNAAGVYTALDANKPIYASGVYHVDLLAAYRTKLFNGKIPARFQINVTDLQYSKTKLVAIDAFPDGTPSAYRIIDPRKWVFSATFDL